MRFKSWVKIFFILIILGIFAYFYFDLNELTGFSVLAETTFTKSTCNENNLCQNFQIKCLGKKVVSIIPIEGSEIQHSKEWKDPRTIEEREKLCE